MNRESHTAATKLVTQILSVRSGETVLISSDSGSSPALASVISEVVLEAGANPIQIWCPDLAHPGAAPPELLRSAAAGADVWIELNEMYYDGTNAHLEAEAAGLRRFHSLTGMTVSDLVSLIGRVDLSVLTTFGERLAELTTGRSELEVSCRNGSSFRASLEGCIAEADTTLMPLGQTHVSPVEESVQGRLVFDGSAFPPASLGVLRETVVVEFEHGQVRVASTGRESEILAAWMDGLRDPDIYRLCHFSYGYHPNVLFPTGRLTNDERVFGCLCVGLGPPIPYQCHTDLTLLRATVQVDGELVQRDGVYIDPQLQELAGSLGVPGYAF